MSLTDEEFEREALARGWRPPVKAKGRVANRILALADGTRSRREIADEAGTNYNYVCEFLKKHGLQDKARKVPTGLRKGTRRGPSPMRCSERNQRICEAIRAGRTYSEVAMEYGLSRQRIEQIARRDGDGLKSAYRDNLAVETRAKVRCVRAAVAMGEGINEACARFGTTYTAVQKYAPEILEAPRRRYQERVRHGVDLVGGGMSIRRAAFRVGISEQTLGRHVAKAGIEPKHGRWKGKGLLAQYQAGEMV